MISYVYDAFVRIDPYKCILYGGRMCFVKMGTITSLRLEPDILISKKVKSKK